MISALLLATVLTLTDPAGDAVGGGELSYPTAEVFRAPGMLDVRELSVYEAEGFTFSLSMAQISNPWNLPNGFSLPIVELYLNTREEGGQEEPLPGSGMRLPDGVLWHYAFRLTGESLELLRARGDGSLEDVTARYDVSLRVEGTVLTVTTSLPRPRHFSLYGVVGGYDPWDPSRWRRVMPEAEAFAFGSPQQAATGVRAADVLADTVDTQVSAIRSGVLPEIRPPSQQAQWPPIIAAGLAITLVGTILRVVVGRRRATEVRASRSRPSIGYGSKPGAGETAGEAPRRRLEPVNLLAALPPPKRDAGVDGVRLEGVSVEGTVEAPATALGATRPARTGRVKVFDAPPADPGPASTSLVREEDLAPDSTADTLEDWDFTESWREEGKLWLDLDEKRTGSRDEVKAGARASRDEEPLEVVEAELLDEDEDGVRPKQTS